MNKNLLKTIIIVFNVLGVLCLVYFAVPYVIHDTVVNNPDAMLPVEAWDSAGMTLSIGLLPLVIVNVLGFVFVKLKNKVTNFLWFIPSIVCFVIVISYWGAS